MKKRPLPIDVRRSKASLLKLTNVANFTSLFTMDLNVGKKIIANEKITPLGQTNLSSKHFIKRYNNKNEL